jgi:hypothetical protein
MGSRMPYSRSGTQISFREPEWVHDLFTGSITDAMAAQARDLEPLTWTVRIEHGEIYVLGCPLAESVRPVAVCRDWAVALGLEEQDYDADEDLRTWFLYEQPWIIEVCSPGGS